MLHDVEYRSLIDNIDTPRRRELARAVDATPKTETVQKAVEEWLTPSVNGALPRILQGRQAG
jgi:hypothetical protein